MYRSPVTVTDIAFPLCISSKNDGPMIKIAVNECLPERFHVDYLLPIRDSK